MVEENNKANDYLLTVIILAGLCLLIYTQFQNIDWQPIIENVIKISKMLFYCIYGLSATASFIYFLRTREKNLTEKIKKKERIKKETQQINNFLDTDIHIKDAIELKKLLEFKYDYWNFLPESKKDTIMGINKKFVQIEKQYNIRSHQEEIWDLNDKLRNLRDDVKTLEWKKRELLLSNEDKENERRYSIKEDLNTYENNVFLKKDLTEQELEILEEEGYQQCNEYCVEQQKNVTVLVKPILNHSKTHTFLVWSVKNLLENYDITHIEEHETKDADLTFKYKNSKYALEIETGSLLRKKQQKLDKVKQLNRKYKNRWMFIVSNKNLLSQYNKLGFATQRKQVAKKLEKLLQK